MMPRMPPNDTALDEADIAELVRRFDAAAQAAGDEHEVLAHLALTVEEGQQAAGALATAFEYRLAVRQASGRRAETAFVPKFASPDGASYPSAVAEVPEEQCRLWAACAARSSSPVVRARLHDLLFERRYGNRRDHARAAVEGYLAIAQQDGGVAIRRADALVRALELARRTAQDDLADQVIPVMVAAVRASLSQSEPQAGVVLRLLEALTYDTAEVAELDELLAATRRAYPDAFTTTHTVALQRRRDGADPARRAELDRELVEAWIAEADGAEPLVRLKHLERAAALARRYGLADVEAQVTSELQRTQPEELGLQPVQAHTEVPAEEVERFLAQFTEAANWQEAFARLLAMGPPSGDVADNRQQAEAHAQEFVFASLVPHTRLGGDGLPRFTPSTPDQVAEAQLADLEALALLFQGPFLGQALDRVGARFGPIPEDELRGFFERAPLVPPPVAGSLARAFGHFFRGDYEAAAYVATPRAETVVRNLVLALDLPVYRVQRAATPGQYPGLGVLLDALAQAGLDPSWHRYLRTLLASPSGLNYRNELTHGFVDQVDQMHAALVLVAVLYLARLPLAARPPETTPAAGDLDATRGPDEPPP
jgi:Domain of unknown function (DUF4209)